MLSSPPGRQLAVAAVSCKQRLGPAGLVARVAVGLLLIYLAFFWNDVSWLDPLLGFVVLPALATGLLALRARRRPQRLVAVGPLGHVLNCAAIVLLLLNPATLVMALLYYGGSVLVAAARRAGGCEVTVVPNLLLGRDDQVGCPLFLPVDLLEEVARRRVGQRTAA